jgi:hypothetical protein
MAVNLFIMKNQTDCTNISIRFGILPREDETPEQDKAQKRSDLITSN